MAAKRSAGVLLHRIGADGLEVMLVHPGGPFWRNKDVGAWQIPKGEIEAGEEPEAAARREVEEELGIALDGPLTPLGEIRQAGGKIVIAYMAPREIDPSTIVSNTIAIEWPPRSGRTITIPEIDAARWLPLHEAGRMMLPSQVPLLERLAQAVSANSADTRAC